MRWIVRRWGTESLSMTFNQLIIALTFPVLSIFILGKFMLICFFSFSSFILFMNIEWVSEWMNKTKYILSMSFISLSCRIFFRIMTSHHYKWTFISSGLFFFLLVLEHIKKVKWEGHATIHTSIHICILFHTLPFVQWIVEWNLSV